MDSFYRAFEDRYRGSRELIKGRLAQYAPFFQPLATLYPGAKTFDLGCGRGEWLELMSEAGFDSTGADLDADMLEACRERNLPAIQADAIEHLASLESNSCALISAFHVVEHISFEQLQSVVSEASRVLRPGGLLIFETPNPENIGVSTNDFYHDPTHQKPIPSLLLSFVVEHGGFDTVKTVRLQESPALRSPDHAVRLLDVIRGVSPDYAVIAQKAADPEIKERFAQAFATDYGLSLGQLADRYEARTDSVRLLMEKIEARIQRMDERLQLVEVEERQVAEGRLQIVEERHRHAEVEQRQVAEGRLQLVEERHRHAEVEQRQEAEARLQLAEERHRHAEELRQRAESQLRDAEARAQHAEAQAQQANALLHAVQHSTSWRVSAPVRIVGAPLRRLTSAISERRLLSGTKRRIKTVLSAGANTLTKRPALKRVALRLVKLSPTLDRRLRTIVTSSAANAVSSSQSQRELSQSAREVLEELRATVRASESR
ncbi:methyltransferase domain-containing protein [Paraburkholderia sp. EG286A]|uniref:methyltransferase domain-containing protein n=1 Tax=Paraburkholderia sp. EG286A TaxID=3237014 RepID=UPI0034D1D724